MSAITLTDRIQVSVRAKNETQANSQKRDTGRNIAKALGNNNISDALADEIGNAVGSTVTDEEDNEWVSMNDFIKAGRKMKEKGAFEEKTTYRYGNVQVIHLPSIPNDAKLKNGFSYGSQQYFSNLRYIGFFEGVEAYLSPYDLPDYAAIVHVISSDRYYVLLSSNKLTIYKKLDPPSETNEVGSETVFNNKNEITNYMENTSLVIPITDVGNLLSLDQYGDLHEETSEGSLIDWDAPNAEVERQISKLHETYYDNGTNGQFVLAGPIEYGSEGDDPNWGEGGS